MGCTASKEDVRTRRGHAGASQRNTPPPRHTQPHTTNLNHTTQTHTTHNNTNDTGPLSKSDIDQRTHAETTDIATIPSAGIKLRYAQLSQRGYYPEDLDKANQDALIVLPQTLGDESHFFAGVFDGHGSDGDLCALFVRDSIEMALHAALKQHPADFERAYCSAFTQINRALHDNSGIDDSMSGTTAITAYLRGRELTVANVGDSRAIIGEQQKSSKRIIAFPLSSDQTPYRKDERERIKALGAVVMSCDQLEGIEPLHEKWGLNLGDEIDNGGDPPRVWAHGKNFPGCAFTRSIGDSVAESIGVTAEPELVRKEITHNDKFLVLASDGVWEFLTNQAVTDMVLKFDDPLEACRAVVSEAYRLWLQFEVRTDDITMVLAFIDMVAPLSEDSTTAALASQRRSPSVLSRRGSAESITLGAGIISAGGEVRPVRRGLSKEKRLALRVGPTRLDDDEQGPASPEKRSQSYPKSADELRRIKEAVRANFLFQHLNDAQARAIYDVMRPLDVRAGDVVIRQDDAGDNFYVVDQGEYSVTISQKGRPAVEVLKYTTKGGTNPCFGELALIHSKPRAASITATIDGRLWAIDRRSFRSILMKSSSNALMRTLRAVDVLKSLSVGQLQRLEDVLTEVSYVDSEYVIRQGETGDSFFVIQEGTVEVVKEGDDGVERHLLQLGPGQYFGERALLENAPRAASVYASGPLKCLHISRDGFEEVLGPLENIIKEDIVWRERRMLERQMREESAGLAGARRADFTLEAAVLSSEAAELVLATHKASGAKYTIKAISKARTAAVVGLGDYMAAELALVTSLSPASAVVPLALTTFADEAYLYAVFKARIVADFEQMLDGVGALGESDAAFYAASLLSGIAHLHGEGYACRNLSPDALMLNAAGQLQLLDLRYAIKLDGPEPTDTCGSAHFFAPEQVKQVGHGKPVDFWALGVLLFQMITGGVPWIIEGEDPDKVSELDLYSRITSHRLGQLARPQGASEELGDLINQLLHPTPDQRIGARGAGVEELRTHEWFDRVQNVEKLLRGELAAPERVMEFCKKAAGELAADGADKLLDEPPFSGDASWCDVVLREEA